MLYSSAELNKKLKLLQEDLAIRRANENEVKSFRCATVEDPESVRPTYDYDAERNVQNMLMLEIIKIKHAINVFNTTTIVDPFNMTVDQILVYMPIMNETANRLKAMSMAKAKKRVANFSSQIIDYEYANYRIEKAKADYEVIRNTIVDLQKALDETNNIKCIELDI